MILLLEDRINKIFDDLYEITYREVDSDKDYIEIIVTDKGSSNVHQLLFKRHTDDLCLSELKSQVIAQACGFVTRKYERMRYERKSTIDAVKKVISKEEQK